MRRANAIDARRSLPSRALRLIVLVTLASCGGATPPPPATTAEADAGPSTAEAPIERACFSGTPENGICEVFSAALEPLPALSEHCRAAGGTWLERCPDDGRIGTCSGEGRRAVYYGGTLGVDAVRDACEREGHTFTP